MAMGQKAGTLIPAGAAACFLRERLSMSIPFFVGKLDI
jgi:hypothetical protein